jgi:hypothetical protein
LLSQLASFDQMIIEMNKYFMQAHDKKELAQMVNNLEKEAHLKDVLSPWSYSLFISLPDFFRHQMLVEREIAGSLKLS